MPSLGWPRKVPEFESCRDEEAPPITGGEDRPALLLLLPKVMPCQGSDGLGHLDQVDLATELNRGSDRTAPGVSQQSGTFELRPIRGKEILQPGVWEFRVSRRLNRHTHPADWTGDVGLRFKTCRGARGLSRATEWAVRDVAGRGGPHRTVIGPERGKSAAGGRLIAALNVDVGHAGAQVL